MTSPYEPTCTDCDDDCDDQQLLEYDGGYCWLHSIARLLDGKTIENHERVYMEFAARELGRRVMEMGLNIDIIIELQREVALLTAKLLDK